MIAHSYTNTLSFTWLIFHQIWQFFVFLSLSIYLRLVELNQKTHIVLLTRHATVDQTHNKYSWINFAIQFVVVDTFLFEFVFFFAFCLMNMISPTKMLTHNKLFKNDKIIWKKIASYEARAKNHSQQNETKIVIRRCKTSVEIKLMWE